MKLKFKYLLIIAALLIVITPIETHTYADDELPDPQGIGVSELSI